MNSAIQMDDSIKNAYKAINAVHQLAKAKGYVLGKEDGYKKGKLDAAMKSASANQKMLIENAVAKAKEEAYAEGMKRAFEKVRDFAEMRHYAEVLEWATRQMGGSDGRN